ncbi:MAG TPA: aminopeptidase N [Micromonosporaceae bacterium]|jgi:aminopeptidase N
MPLGNLTRTEAEQRAAILRVDAYDLEFDLTGGDETFRSRSTVRFDCSQPGADTFLDLLAAEITSVTLNGRELDPATVYRDGRVHLDGLAESNTATVEAICRYGHDSEGMHRAVDPADGEAYIYTQFESDYARQVYACFEQPDLKATFQIDVIAPEGWKVFSNMPTRSEEGTHWSFEPTPRLSTYLTVIVAGPYHVVRDEHVMKLPDGSEVTIPMALGCRQSLAQYLDADEFLQITKDGLDFIVGHFGIPYPFPKYDQMLVPEYNGAMEHPGCVTFTDGSFVYRQAVTDAQREMRAYVILHEMAHMWFGDLVTMRWWNDIWLNEAFATYVGALALVGSSRFTNGWATFNSNQKSGAKLADQRSTTHPIAGEVEDLATVQAAFDHITYRKGASVLRQLAAWVGAEGFATGVHNYFVEHAWGNATAADFLGALADASGRDLDAWADEWLRATGINTMAADFTVGDDGTFTSFAVVQETEPLRAHRIAIGSYALEGNALTRINRVELDVVGARTDVPEMVGTRCPDLILLNDDDLSYVKVRLDERSLATASEHAGAITDPLARSLVWSTAWDMCQDAQMTATDYVAMVLRGVDAETMAATLRTLIDQCVQALYYFGGPDEYPAGLAKIAAHARRRLTELPIDDPSRLTWLGALSRTATSDEDLDLLAGLLDGTQTLPGIEITGDIRWQVVTGLARSGRIDVPAIDAEQARDNTTSGVESAAAARASIPTEAAKAAAWALATDSKQPTHLRIHTALGFGQEGQAALRSRYTDEYFELTPTFFEGSTLLGRALVRLLYPLEEVSQDTIARTEAFLERPDLPKSLRRMLMECRDDVARSLRARQAAAKAS